MPTTRQPFVSHLKQICQSGGHVSKHCDLVSVLSSFNIASEWCCHLFFFFFFHNTVGCSSAERESESETEREREAFSEKSNNMFFSRADGKFLHILPSFPSYLPLPPPILMIRLLQIYNSLHERFPPCSLSMWVNGGAGGSCYFSLCHLCVLSIPVWVHTTTDAVVCCRVRI